jgi:hypothetical protein
MKQQVKELSRLAQATQTAACMCVPRFPACIFCNILLRYIAARSDGQDRSMKEVLGACKEWQVSHQQLDGANRAIQRILGVSLPPLTARKMVEHWADSLKLPAAVAQAAAEIADNCSSITVTRSTVETVDYERLQELSGQGYTLKQQISPSPNAAGSAAQIMCNHVPCRRPPTSLPSLRRITGTK